MIPSCLHLHHLSQIINTADAAPVRPPVPAETIAHFYDTIAPARISTNGCNWQRRSISGLLWHLPDLLPAGRAAVETYVMAQWRLYDSEAKTKPVPPKDNPDEKPISAVAPRSTDVAHVPAQRPDALETGEADQTQTDLFWRTDYQPDWFDRFTDWIAAVVSLFKR